MLSLLRTMLKIVRSDLCFFGNSLSLISTSLYIFLHFFLKSKLIYSSSSLISCSKISKLKHVKNSKKWDKMGFNVWFRIVFHFEILAVVFMHFRWDFYIFCISVQCSHDNISKGLAQPAHEGCFVGRFVLILAYCSGSDEFWYCSLLFV